MCKLRISFLNYLLNVVNDCLYQTDLGRFPRPLRTRPPPTLDPYTPRRPGSPSCPPAKRVRLSAAPWHLLSPQSSAAKPVKINIRDVYFIYVSQKSSQLFVHTVHKDNKRPMGHIAYLRNQFKSIHTFAQSYDYIIMLIWRRKKNHLFDN